MKYLRILFLSLVLFVMTAQVSPVSAAGPWQNFSNNLKARFNRVYLMLPGSKSGQAVLTQASLAMSRVKSFETIMTADAEVINTSGQNMMMGKMTVTGPVEVKDVYDPQTAKQDMNVMAEMTMQGTTLKGNADIKMNGTTSYIKINEVPVMPFMDITKLKGQWLKIDTKLPESDAKKSKEENRQHLEAAFQQLVRDSVVSAARKEKLDGHNVFMVDITVPDQAMVNYFKKIGELEQVPAEQIEDQAKSLTESLAALEELKASVAIDRSSYFVRQVRLPVTVDVTQAASGSTANAAASASPFGDLSAVKTVKSSFALTMDKFNQPVSFETPAESRDFQEAMMEVFGATGMMSQGGQVPMVPEAKTNPAGKMVPGKMMPPGSRPSELPELSAEEKAILKQYGVEVEGL